MMLGFLKSRILSYFKKNSETPPPADNRESQPRIRASFTIGLDFGSSTTKCILFASTDQGRVEKRIFIPIGGFQLFPSHAWEKDGSIYLGVRPCDSAHELRSPKIHMRCALLGQSPPDDIFLQLGLDPRALCWAILSYCTAEIKNRIATIFPVNRFEYDFSLASNDCQWVLGAPLDGLAEKENRREYVDLIYWAVHHPFEWSGSWPSASTIAKGFSRLPRMHPVPLEEEAGFSFAGNCIVQPEALVAVNSFLELGGNIEDGIYYVCDIGAGTTDVAFFRFSQESERQISLYGANSVLAGADDLARALAAANRWSVERSEQFLSSSSPALASPRIASALGETTRLITEGVDLAFRRAYLKEQLMKRWKTDLKGASVIGGGARIDSLRLACLQPLRTRNGTETISIREVHLKEDLPEGASFLHRIACGLSTPPQRFFEHWRLDQVEDFRPSLGERCQTLYCEEIYAK